MLLILLIVVLLCAASLSWVWRDARRRHHDPRLALATALLGWPLGLSLWLMIRSPHQLAPKGMGTPWG